MAAVTADMFIPMARVRLTAHLTEHDIAAMNIELTSEGVSVNSLLNKLGRAYKQVRKVASNMGDESQMEVSLLKDQEHLLSLQIKNQEKLGLLIEKEAAQTRMHRTLSLFNSMLQRAVKRLATEIPGDIRSNEILITTVFNTLSKQVVEEEARILSWEDDGVTRLLRTRIGAVRTQQPQTEIESKGIDYEDIAMDLEEA